MFFPRASEVHVHISDQIRCSHHMYPFQYPKHSTKVTIQLSSPLAVCTAQSFHCMVFDANIIGCYNIDPVVHSCIYL